VDALAASLTIISPNEPPVVTISSPASGTTYNCPAAVNFSAAASDPEGASLTSSISWFDNAVGFGLGGAVSRGYDCNEAGTHNITALVADTVGLTDTDMISIQLRVCKPKATACTLNSECCSNNCSGKRGAKVCK
jgi:chitinase